MDTKEPKTEAQHTPGPCRTISEVMYRYPGEMPPASDSERIAIMDAYQMASAKAARIGRSAARGSTKRGDKAQDRADAECSARMEALILARRAKGGK